MSRKNVLFTLNWNSFYLNSENYCSDNNINNNLAIESTFLVIMYSYVNILFNVSWNPGYTVITKRDHQRIFNLNLLLLSSWSISDSCASLRMANKQQIIINSSDWQTVCAFFCGASTVISSPTINSSGSVCTIWYIAYLHAVIHNINTLVWLQLGHKEQTPFNSTW